MAVTFNRDRAILICRFPPALFVVRVYDMTTLN